MRVLRGVVYMTKSSGPRTEPCGTPHVTGLESFENNRVSGVKWSGKFFTETNKQKFSLGGIQCKKICSHPG